MGSQDKTGSPAKRGVLRPVALRNPAVFWIGVPSFGARRVVLSGPGLVGRFGTVTRS